jgi:peptide deformylase
MAIRDIRLDSDPILRKKSREIENIDSRILELLDDLADTMYVADGVGIAAPQIGVLRRAIVVDIGEGPIKMINPNIVLEEGSEIKPEGCLSVPGYTGLVERPFKVNVEYIDENGVEVFLEAQELLARAICHEIDHLNGILYTDKATEIQKLEEIDNDEKH